MDLIIWIIILPLLTAFILGILKIYTRKIFYIWAVGSTLLYTYIIIHIISSDVPLIYSVGDWGLLGINIMLDSFSRLFLFIIVLLFITVIIFSLKYISINKYKYFILVFLMIGGIAGMVITADLFNLYVFLEVSSLSSFALVAVKKTDKAVEGSFKYLILATIGSFFILLATILIYHLTGTLNMAEIAVELENSSTFIKNTLITFFMFGYGIKIGLIPLHAWLPDAYEGSPIPYNVLSSGLVMKSGIYALIRIIYIIFGLNFLLENGILEIGIFWGILTFLIAHTLAFQQSNLRRLLGYSSIAQVGYIMVGLFLGSEAGVIGGNFHILNHAIMKGALFLVLGIYYYSVNADDLEGIQGLGYIFPGISFIFIIAALAIVGLPPLNGFVSKWLIIEAAIEAEYYWAAFFIPVGTFLSLTYYLRVIMKLYTKPEKDILIENNPDLSLKLPAVFLGGLCLFFGLFPSIPLSLINEIPEILLENQGYIRILLGG